MIRLSEIKLTLAQAEQPAASLLAAATRILGVPAAAVAQVEVFKRSFDARKAELAAVYIVDVTLA
ncbi:MAG: FAD-dependent oxidoreductase, partial [Ramlibacter sp.]